MSYKENIYNLEQNDNDITFLFKGTDQTAANLRNFIKNEIYSYCIDQVIFFNCPSSYTEECLALRLGLLVPNNLLCRDDTVGIINIKGPKMVMTSDIQNLNIIHQMPICFLNENEELHCHLKVKRANGKTYQKWNPVSGITFKNVNFKNNNNDVYQFKFSLIGLLSIDDIMSQLI